MLHLSHVYTMLHLFKSSEWKKKYIQTYEYIDWSDTQKNVSNEYSPLSKHYFHLCAFKKMLKYIFIYRT